MDALKLAFVTLLVDDGDPLGIRKEDANDGRAVFDVRAERIVENVFYFSGERMRQVPASGTRSQSGRCASSYSIS